jgi:hypothetical protein
MAEAYQREFFNVSFPAEYVAHVEINRPEKLNAFKEVYVQATVSFPKVRDIKLSPGVTYWHLVLQEQRRMHTSIETMLRMLLDVHIL